MAFDVSAARKPCYLAGNQWSAGNAVVAKKPGNFSRIAWPEKAAPLGSVVFAAARLQDLTKDFGCQLMVSHIVAATAGIDMAAFPEREVRVRGREAPLAGISLLSGGIVNPHGVPTRFRRSSAAGSAKWMSTEGDSREYSR